jgi:DNA repair exonuclease SbcCD ATPase subunit
MKNRRKVWGWVFVIFGWTGVGICIAGTVCLWIVTLRTSAAVERVVSRVTEFTTEIGQHSAQAEKRVGKLEEQLEDFEQQIREAVKQAVKEQLADAEALVALRARLSEFSTQVRTWRAAAESARDLIDMLGDLLAPFGLEIGNSDKRDLHTALASVVDLAENLSATLDELAIALDTPGVGLELPKSDRQVKRPRLDNALAELGRHTSAFSDSLRAIESSAIELRKHIVGRLRICALLLTLLLAWGAFAQFALARWGKRITTGAAAQST